jgi:hypothetical protein
MPWTFAGLAAGGFELRDPLAPAALPMPGVAEAQAPLAWYDSAAVVVGEGAAWRGFGAALASGELIVAPPTGRKPRSVWTAVSGSNAIDRNGISVARGDERSWFRGGAVAGRRGGIGDLDLAGDHLWTLGGGVRRGANLVEASFAQRGMGERQVFGFGESAKGETGSAAWAWSDGLRDLSLRASRGHDARESFGIGGYLSSVSRRDAQTDAVELMGVKRGNGREWAGRIEVTDGLVTRWTGSAANREAWRERSVWGALRHERPFAGGRIELELGGGHHDAATRSAERWQLAPAASWRLVRGGRSLRLFGERAVAPIWSDLAAGAVAFVQDSWIGGMEAGAKGAASHAGILVLAGSVGGRASFFRYPIRDLGLYYGYAADPSRYGFVLGSAEAATSWRALGAEVSGYGITAGSNPGRLRTDPATGASSALTGAFRLFAGDLGVKLRAQGAWVGPRYADTHVPGYFDDARLPGYATFSATAELTLGDATMVFRGDGLEDVRREQSWLDLGAYPEAVLARDSGKTFRFELIWPLFN